MRLASSTRAIADYKIERKNLLNLDKTAMNPH